MCVFIVDLTSFSHKINPECQTRKNKIEILHYAGRDLGVDSAVSQFCFFSFRYLDLVQERLLCYSRTNWNLDRVGL